MYLPAVGGGECSYQEYSSAAGVTYKNWSFLCPKCPKSDGCKKTRGVGPYSTKRHGDLEPLAFLHAWRDVAVPCGKTHRHISPSAEEIDAEIVRNRDAFKDLHAMFIA